MPDFPAGPVWGHPRYRIDGLQRRDLFHHHHGYMTPAPLEGEIADDDRVRVRFQSIDYSRFLPNNGETFPAYVARRRRELLTEARRLASYHELTAHLPQILDVITGENLWDPAIRQHGLQNDEPCLVIEQITAEPLNRIQQPLALHTVLEIAEKLLMLLRVFHHKDLRDAVSRYFVLLSPDDILIDRHSRDCWLRNLWKLRSFEELRDPHSVICCEPELHAYVSPIITGRLFPRGPQSVRPPDGMRPDDLDLYSLGIILYSLLSGRFDLSSTPAGFLDARELDRLARARALPDDVKVFLQGLLDYRFHSAQTALDALTTLSGSPRHPTFMPVRPPNSPPTRDLKEKQVDPGSVLEAGTRIGDRYVIDRLVFIGGQGLIYLGEDTRTSGRVMLKTARLGLNDAGTAGPPTPQSRQAELRERWTEWKNEALLAIRMHNLSGAVPQLVDLVETPATAADLHGQTEPVLVLEYIPGRNLFAPENRREYAEAELLEMLEGLCAFAARLHQPDARGNFHLYVDWKPHNIMRHPETGNLTVVDLGAIAPVIQGQVRGALFSTDPFAAPEEFLPGTREINKQLTPAYDVHGIAAVLWAVATDPTKEDLLPLITAVRDGSASYPVLDADLLPDTMKQLRPILRQGLAAELSGRFPDAGAMGQAVRQAMARLNGFPPDPPSRLTGHPTGPATVSLSGELYADAGVAQVVICRGRQPVLDHRSAVVHQVDVDDADPRVSFDWQDDSVDSNWQEIHYTVFAIGHNGQVSVPARLEVPLVAPPENPVAEALEESVRVAWTVPPSLRRSGGRVVLQLRTPRGYRTVYEGLDESFTASGLQPAETYHFRIHSRCETVASNHQTLEASPLPRLAEVLELTTEPGDSQITLHWKLSDGAADELVFLRSQQPLSHHDIAQAHQRCQFTPIRFTHGDRRRIRGLESSTGATLQHNADGTWQGTWTDTTVQPGVTYYYTPRLAYRPADRSWTGRTDPNQPPLSIGDFAFAEVENFQARSLPGAVILTWEIPSRAAALRLQRFDEHGRLLGNAIVMQWSTPEDERQPAQEDSHSDRRSSARPVSISPSHPRYVDRRSDHRPVTYRLQAVYRGRTSHGVEQTAAPSPPTVIRLPASQRRTASPAGVRLTRNPEGVTVLWEPGEANDLAMVTLPDSACTKIVPADRGECVFPADRGEVGRASVRCISAGAVSPPGFSGAESYPDVPSPGGDEQGEPV